MENFQISPDNETTESPLWKNGLKIVRLLRENGHAALFAGGCVRDLYLKLPIEDIDIATDARPEAVQKIFRRTAPVGAQFGVVLVMIGKFEYQVAAFREDLAYSDGRRPDEIRYCSPEEDAKRRDFTINGMFYDPIKGEALDYVGGREDLRKRTIRAIGDPDERIEEDKLRMLRAVRFSCRFGFEIDAATASAIGRRCTEIAVVSQERIENELSKILECPNAMDGIARLNELGLLRHVVCVECGARLEEGWRAWETSFAIKEKRTKQKAFSIFLAPLVLDKNLDFDRKKRALVETIGKWHRFSRELVKKIGDAFANLSSIRDIDDLSLSEAKKLVRSPDFSSHLEIYESLAAWSGANPEKAQKCREFLSSLSMNDLNPKPLLTGKDLIDLGIPQGPAFKKILDLLENEQLEGKLNDSREALEWARLQYGQIGV